MNREYKYWGALNFRNTKRSRFLTPLFHAEGQFYYQEIVNDKVKSFIEVAEPAAEFITKPKIDAQLSIESDALFCFNINESDTIEGTRNDIEDKLFKLLSSASNLNVHSKLLIANFLNLYQAQIELINEANKDLEQFGIANQISLETPFKNKRPELIENAASQIVNKLKKVHQIKGDYKVDDIAYVKDQRVYFQAYSTDIENVLNKNSATDKFLDSVIGQLANKYFETNESINDLIKNERQSVYDFLLCSKTFQIENTEWDKIYSGIKEERQISEQFDNIHKTDKIKPDNILEQTKSQIINKFISSLSYEK